MSKIEMIKYIFLEKRYSLEKLTQAISRIVLYGITAMGIGLYILAYTTSDESLTLRLKEMFSFGPSSGFFWLLLVVFVTAHIDIFKDVVLRIARPIIEEFTKTASYRSLIDHLKTDKDFLDLVRKTVEGVRVSDVPTNKTEFDTATKIKYGRSKR